MSSSIVSRHLAAELGDEALCGLDDVLRLLVVEAERAHVLLDLELVGPGEVGRGGVALEQRRGRLVHAHVGGLRAEDDRDQQLVGVRRSAARRAGRRRPPRAARRRSGARRSRSLAESCGTGSSDARAADIGGLLGGSGVSGLLCPSRRFQQLGAGETKNSAQARSTTAPTRIASPGPTSLAERTEDERRDRHEAHERHDEQRHHAAAQLARRAQLDRRVRERVDAEHACAAERPTAASTARAGARARTR